MLTLVDCVMFFSIVGPLLAMIIKDVAEWIFARLTK